MRSLETAKTKKKDISSPLPVDQVVSVKVFEFTRFARLHFLKSFLEGCEVKCESPDMDGASSGSRSGHSSPDDNSDCYVRITREIPRPPRTSPRCSPRRSPRRTPHLSSGEHPGSGDERDIDMGDLWKYHFDKIIDTHSGEAEKASTKAHKYVCVIAARHFCLWNSDGHRSGSPNRPDHSESLCNYDLCQLQEEIFSGAKQRIFCVEVEKET